MSPRHLERDLAMLELRRAGLSLSEVARVFGVSRNAVAGAMFRLLRADYVAIVKARRRAAPSRRRSPPPPPPPPLRPIASPWNPATDPKPDWLKRGAGR